VAVEAPGTQRSKGQNDRRIEEIIILRTKYVPYYGVLRTLSYYSLAWRNGDFIETTTTTTTKKKAAAPDKTKKQKKRVLQSTILLQHTRINIEHTSSINIDEQQQQILFYFYMHSNSY
jgi:hypothetical protein